MGLSDDEQLRILIQRLTKQKYALDDKERQHLMSLIKRGVIKIDKEEPDANSGTT